MPATHLERFQRAAAEFVRAKGLFLNAVEQLSEAFKAVPPDQVPAVTSWALGYNWGAKPPPPLPIPSEFAHTPRPRFDRN